MHGERVGRIREAIAHEEYEEALRLWKAYARQWQHAVERGISERDDHTWYLGGDEADVEFWVTMFPGELLLTLRLSDERLRHRDYKVAHMPGSLRPSSRNE